ncbi:hypothetical protein HUG15_05780 [Salicibibacter cibarius]|uniref:Gp28/Gp37-like domain-containing protein n=1 Tax=Salicibibacter cibarius TaxID=2743000 RepID=A0A7T7CAR0_9BACI|nr:hypothetical protein [Salicibibacter cibarius]QQK75104.1 hypothetical protein HUG15_05450 [Salicibibacter cibarius]QQK75164.1 hypothetical protein HUG15_05780 [Salicibibacter cibarius]
MKPIRILSPNFVLQAEIDRYSSYQRTNRWHSPGEFELHVNRHMQGADLLRKGNYIVTMEPETEQTSIERDEDLSSGMLANLEVT